MRPGPFFRRKEIWLPTWRAWLIALALFAVALIGVIKFLPAFLSPVRPINAPILIVEGWSEENCLKRSLEIFREGNYKLLLVSGGPVEKGLHISSYESYAKLGESRLREFGFSGTNIFAVPAPDVEKDRTYYAALAVKSFLITNNTGRAVNLVSSGTHARRSGLIYGFAMEPDIEVGVISVPNPEFDEARWWKKSQGVRTVMSETIAYLYARLLFRPE